MRKAYSTTVTIARQDGFVAARATYQPFPRHLQYGTMFPVQGDGTAECGAGAEGWRERPALALCFPS